MEAAMLRPQNRDHREAVSLSWKSRHIPFGTILMASLIVASVLSAILTITAQGPANGMP
jgi:hypothetical protein